MWLPDQTTPRPRARGRGLTVTTTAPKGTGPAGKALWDSITGTYGLETHELSMLASAVVTADRIADLDAVVSAEGVMLNDPKRGPIAHPALVEARQQRLVLARVIGTLRLPDQDDHLPRRRGVRGTYGGGRRG